MCGIYEVIMEQFHVATRYARFFLSEDGRRTREKQNHWSKIPDCLERACPLWTRYRMKEDISGKLNNVSLPDNAFCVKLNTKQNKP